MKRETDIVTVSPGVVLQEITEPFPAESIQEQGPGLLATLGSLLRGRYHWVILLAAIGVVSGAMIGYRMPPVLYHSTGMVRIRPVIPAILRQNDQNGMMPMFDAFVQAQVTLLSSQRTIDVAMQNPEWQKFNRGLAPETVEGFSQSLEVSRTLGSEIVIVGFTDVDPKATMAAVRSVIEAYQALYGENDAESSTQRMKVLDELRAKYYTELKSLNDRILAIGTELGSASIEPMYQFKLEELNRLESELRQVRVSLAAFEELTPEPQAATQSTSLSVTQIAANDPEMRDLLQERAALLREIEKFRIRYGTNHPSLVERQTALMLLDRDIEQIRQAYNHPGQPGVKSLADRPAEQLRLRERNIRKLYEAAKAETTELGRKGLQIAALRAEADIVRVRLQETKDRIESLNVESIMSGRISVLSYGDRPLLPFRDKRKSVAIVAGMGGASLGVGIILLIGLMDRRLRNIADARGIAGRNVRFLGVLPDLPSRLADPEQAEIAAHCVHHIRASLQMNRRGEDDRVYAFTSPAAGDGKTSLTLALGYSFAVSGARTLLIDFDMVGGGLTRRMDGRGQQPGNRRLADGNSGLLRVIRGGDLQEAVIATSTPGLCLLPLGDAAAKHVGQLSISAVRSVIAQAREHYDIVLIDTGPILGSLEASLITAQADLTVMTITQGRHRALVTHALEQLAHPPVHLAGIVFNRARTTDMRSCFSAGSLRSGMEQGLVKVKTVNGGQDNRIGPIASAIADAAQRENNQH